MNLNFDYSIIKNRTNTSNDFSDKDFSRIHKVLNSNETFSTDKRYSKLWSVLQLIGDKGHFNVENLFVQNMTLKGFHSKGKGLYGKHHYKIHRFLVRKLTTKQWHRVILKMMSLLGISSQYINHVNARYHHQKKLDRKNKKLFKKAIRFYNFLKVDKYFFDRDKVTILTKWQLQQIDTDMIIIMLSKNLINQSKSNTTYLGSLVLEIFEEIYFLQHSDYISKKRKTNFFNRLCHTKYLKGNLEKNKQDLKFLSNIKDGKQWYLILLNLIDPADKEFIIKTMKGNTAMENQYKYQRRSISDLEDIGEPIKGDYYYYFHYDCPNNDKSKLVHNPARKFYKQSQSQKNEQIHEALKLMKNSNK